MDVSIIIVNYNTHKMTQNCIESVYDKTEGVEFEVILVDNASTDGSRNVFEQDSRIKYIYCSENIGFGRANNLGYRFALGKYIFLLNSDTLLLNNAIFEMFSFMERTTMEVGCIGCELVDESYNDTHSYGVFPDMANFIGRILVSYRIKINCLLGEPSHKNTNYPIRVDYICGADLFIRRIVIEECGMFDPDFFLYFEETEMQHRFHKKGYYSEIINTPKIMHLQGGSNKKVTSSRRSLKVANLEMTSRFLYSNKVLGRKRRKIIALIHCVLIPRILLYNASWKERKEMVATILNNCRD